MNKIDPTLKEFKREAMDLADTSVAQRSVGVLVQFTGDISDIHAIGLVTSTVKKHPNGRFTLAAGVLPIDRLDDLAAIQHVLRIEASRTFTPELDSSVGEIGAAALHTGTSAFTGSGVVVGIIDSGIDYRHQVFRKADGTSRLLAIWDQDITAEGSETSPSSYALGVEYVKSEIDAALAGGSPTSSIRSYDTTKGHGTHVAGIAAGDGSQAGNCHGVDHYVGVAPDADLIVVNVNSGDDEALGNSMNLINAFEYIFGHPDASGRPVVINLSMGDNLGPHDGSNLVELFIDLFMLEQPGRAIIKSAGNEGNDNRHVTATVPAGGSLDVDFEVPAGIGYRRFIDLWYLNGHTLDVEVVAPGVASPASPRVSPDDADNTWVVNPAAVAGSQMRVVIDSNTNAGGGSDSQIRLTLRPPTSGNLISGWWKVRLTNTGAADAAFHAWIERGTNTPHFRTSGGAAGAVLASDDSTISIPGTSEYVITVGAYSTGAGASGNLAAFSSRGPTRDNRIKPEITAPGVAITSATSRVDEKTSCGCCCDCCLDFYTRKSGTSMAAPHVTGVVALMLQKNPGLDINEIRTHLTASARNPGQGGATPNNQWGFGRLSAQAAVAAVPAPAVSGGGGAVPAGPSSPIRVPVHSPRPSVLQPAGPLGGLQPILAQLRKTALSSEERTLCAALISRHFSEARGLINSNRKLATLWHRGHGPLLLRHTLDRVRFPLIARPEKFDAPEYEQLVMRFITALGRYGSHDLQEDIESYAPRFVSLLKNPLYGQPDTASDYRH
ncbi:hypothetical protein MNBD_GAMMA17-1979 [hydrothermal vent metagenome]|uniref:Peptidase S8/S53 domain-containing protein n=1 Tax=hydrothermal vent metagenome TaxID=652676 RepID=A0A3B0ZEJ6_9ZZZZ